MKLFNKLEKKDKIFCLIFVVVTALIFVLNIFKITNFTFLLLSILANLFIIFLLNKTLKLLNIKFNKNQKLIILLIIIIINIFYFYSVLNRNFIYYWDYSCYYNLQLITKSNFNISLIQGIKGFVGSTWSGEYGTFLSFFPEIIFNFTNKTIDFYLLSCVITFIPYIIISLSILLKLIIKKLNIQKENLFFCLGLSIFSLMPILHATFIYGQPDLFGLFFVFLIIALTIDFEFKELDLKRLILLFLFTYMLLITRRWYVYFILSYYICYVIKIIIKNVNDKEKIFKIIKNGLVFVLFAGLFFLLTLFPLVKNIISSNYSSSYAFYLTGGFMSEIISQINHLGYALYLIIIVGLLYGLKKKEYRLITVLSLLQYFFTVFLFTRIQNMGLHHTLVLLPVYLYQIYLFIVFLFNLKNKKNIHFKHKYNNYINY